MLGFECDQMSTKSREFGINILACILLRTKTTNTPNDWCLPVFTVPLVPAISDSSYDLPFAGAIAKLADFNHGESSRPHFTTSLASNGNGSWSSQFLSCVETHHV